MAPGNPRGYFLFLQKATREVKGLGRIQKATAAATTMMILITVMRKGSLAAMVILYCTQRLSQLKLQADKLNGAIHQLLSEIDDNNPKNAHMISTLYHHS
jgi:hypothetical protein